MKQIALASTVCAVALTGNLQAQLIGDFEGALDPGWTQVGSTVITPSTTWASSGSYSLQITSPLNAFDWGLQFNDVTVAQQLSSTHLLQFDVHWETSEWFDPDGNAWVRWDIGSLNSDITGWSQINDSGITDPANPSFPGSWDTVNWGASHTRTLTYDFTGLGFDATGASWAQFNLAFNMGNVDSQGNFYMDNVRLVPVPEPSTFALFGLGALFLAIRRRLH